MISTSRSSHTSEVVAPTPSDEAIWSELDGVEYILDPSKGSGVIFGEGFTPVTLDRAITRLPGDGGRLIKITADLWDHEAAAKTAAKHLTEEPATERAAAFMRASELTAKAEAAEEAEKGR